MSEPSLRLATSLIETGDANSMRIGIGHLFSLQLARDATAPIDSPPQPSSDHLDGILVTATHLLHELDIEKGLN
jgi:hypothetical protein